MNKILYKVFFFHVEIEYAIKVKTGNYRNSGSNGPVYLKIFDRDNRQTEDLLLKTTSTEKLFTQDSIKEFQIQAIDIGKPQRIIIRHEDKTNGWYIDYVDVTVHDFHIRCVISKSYLLIKLY